MHAHAKRAFGACSRVWQLSAKIKAYCKDGAEAEELFKKLDIHDHKELQSSSCAAAKDTNE